MEILIGGLLLWALVHLSPSLLQTLRTGLIAKIGDNGYKALFSLLIIVSLVMISYGWRHTVPSHLYLLPAFTKHIAMLLILIAFILLGAAYYNTRIKILIRHPQLTGVVVWSFAHLLINGDSRSVLLFGCMGIWAILEMIFINRRDGIWIKPSAPRWSKEFTGLAISLVIFLVAAMAHPYLSGVALR